MNEVNLVRVSPAPVQPPNPPKVTANEEAASQGTNGGKSLPDSVSTDETSNASRLQAVQSVEAERAETEEAKAEKLQAAVDHVNDFVQNVQRDLHFAVDEDTEQTVVKVVESSSGEIIRQIPDETFLELARKMKEQGEMQLVNAQG